jgi:hypothetical protein
MTRTFCILLKENNNAEEDCTSSLPSSDGIQRSEYRRFSLSVVNWDLENAT